MSNLDVTFVGDGTCEIRHRESGASVRSVKAPEFGGAGNGFSATDLLAAALGSCIASNLEPVLLRHGMPLHAARLSVSKQLGTHPKRVESLAVTVRIDRGIAPGLLTRLRRAAAQCVVHDSLSPDVSVSISFEVD